MHDNAFFNTLSTSVSPYPSINRTSCTFLRFSIHMDSRYNPGERRHLYFWHSAEEEKDKNTEKRVDMISGFASVSPLALLRHRALFVGGFFLSFCRFLVEEKTGDRRD